MYVTSPTGNSASEIQANTRKSRVFTVATPTPMRTPSDGSPTLGFTVYLRCQIH